MNKVIRDTIFIVFIIIFIILSIISCLYAAGYKFNLTKPWRTSTIIQKTGLINISTSPKQARVYINNKLTRSSSLFPLKRNQVRTPLKIQNLLPGEYSVRLEKDDYWPWEKKVIIYSGQISYLDNINLFRYNLPLLLVENPGNKKLMCSNNDNSLLYINNDLSKHQVINAKTGQIINLETRELNKSQLNQIAWMKTADKLFLAGQIYDIDKNNLSAQLNKLNTKLDQGEDLIWFYQINEDKIFYYHQDGIYQLSAENDSDKQILPITEVIDFYIWQNNIYLIKQVGKQLLLLNYDLRTAQIIENLPLPNLGEYYFQGLNNKYLNIYDARENNLYLININNWTKSFNIKNVQNWTWLNSNQILYSNDWEIYIFSINTKSSNLILRWGEKIEQIILNTKKSYALFNSKNSINILDLKTNDTLNIIQAQNINNLNLDQKNNLLYFGAEIKIDDDNTEAENSQKGIYKVLIK